jgi:hypothetical protein
VWVLPHAGVFTTEGQEGQPLQDLLQQCRVAVPASNRYKQNAAWWLDTMLIVLATHIQNPVLSLICCSRTISVKPGQGKDPTYHTSHRSQTKAPRLTCTS